ncbi:MAG TPA: ABC transporter ATP-binding protein [Candidatus Limnocylindrales bacterium]|nr:ABC transporter ATP-binding protein [Candidatus Limnocylindrales bacterium]
MGLEVKHITSGYGSTVVLRDLSLQVSDGQILGVLGRNGMGKTTLIRCLSGLLPAITGSIIFDGHDITHLSPHERAYLGITTVVQGRGIFPDLTVRENLELGRIASGRAQRNRMDEVLNYFEPLGRRLNQPGGTLSGGEQQMLAIGRGLMTSPRIMLLDEPSEGIMPILVKKIAQILKEINRRENMMIIIVEQNVPMVFTMTDHCIILEKGRIVAEGTPAELSNSTVMKEYLAV